RSASQDAGFAPQAKAEVSAEIAALLVFSALENGDRAGLLLFTDKIERYVPPRRGMKHGLRLITETLAFQPRGRGTDIAGALEHLTTAQRRKAVVFVVSDFLADGYENPLAVLSRRHDVVPVVVSDPVEGKLPEATPLGLDVQVAPEQVSLGEHVLVRIAVDHESRDVYSLTGFDPSPLAVPQGTPPMKVHREELPEGHARTVFELTLADYG